MNEALMMPFMEEWIKKNPMDSDPFQHNQNSLDFGMRYANAPDMSQYSSLGGLMGLGNSMQSARPDAVQSQPTDNRMSYLQSLLY